MTAEEVIPYYCAASGFLGLLVVAFLIDYQTDEKTTEEIEALDSKNNN